MRTAILKRLNLVVFLKSIVIGLFVLVSWSSVDRLYSYYSFTNNDTIWIDGFSWSVFLSYFSSILLVSIPMVGVFLKQKIAWILIASYFYSPLISVVYYAFSDWDTEPIWQLVTLPFLVLFILLVNRKSVSNYYEIPRTKLLRMNIIASTMGMLLSIGLVARGLL